MENVSSGSIGTQESKPPSPSAFLQLLRERPSAEEWLWGARWGVYGERMKKQIIDHASEYPRKLRACILETSERTSQEFYTEVFAALKVMLLCVPQDLKKGKDKDSGSSTSDNDEETEDIPWGGLDSVIDTEDQVEVAIRSFPHVLTEKRTKSDVSSPNSHPIDCLTTSIRSLSFIPLLARLGIELGRAYMSEVVSNQSTVIFLLDCSITQSMDSVFDHGLQESSVSILRRLKQERLISRQDLSCCLMQVLSRTYSSRATDTQIRFLINWYPAMLKYFPNDLEYTPLRFLCCLLKHHPSPNNNTEETNMAMIRILLELGLVHYPNELGFLFYGTNWRNSLGSAYSIACDIFGKEALIETMDKLLSRCMMNRPDAILKLVVAAAANKDSPCDAIYFFLRQDPTAIFPSMTSGTTT